MSSYPPLRPSTELDTEKQSTAAHNEDANLDMIADEEETGIPPGYFRSKFFIGTMAGIGLGLMAGVAGYAYAAPILSIINEDIGPVGYPIISPPSIVHSHRFFFFLLI
jgi:hypothetical protein